MHEEIQTYQRQGFGSTLAIQPPFGLLIVDFVNGFANPDVFGGGNINAAIENTVPLLAAARRNGWPVAHSRIVFADDDADENVFTIKVPGMLTLKEDHPNSAIVPQLAPVAGELVVRKTVPSAFFAWHSKVSPVLAARQRPPQLTVTSAPVCSLKPLTTDATGPLFIHKS